MLQRDSIQLCSTEKKTEKIKSKIQRRPQEMIIFLELNYQTQHLLKLAVLVSYVIDQDN